MNFPSDPTARRELVLRVSAVLALIGLALICWPLASPHPLAVLIGLTIGQAIGTLSFLLYLLVVASEFSVWVRARVESGARPKSSE